MRKYLTLFITSAVFLGLVAAGPVALAAGNNTFRHEFDINPTETVLSFGEGFAFGTETVYRYAVLPELQLSSTLGFGISDRNTTTTTGLLLMVGPSINLPFDFDPASSFFLSSQAGLYWRTGGGSFEQFAFAFDFGKRFQIFENVTYKPFFRFGRTTEASVRFYVYFIAGSIIF